MRTLAWAAFLLFLAMAAPRPAVAPTMMENHLDPITGTLAPFETRTLPPFGFDGSPLAAGWVFLLEAKANGTLQVQLAHGSSVAGTWSIPADAPWYATTVLPEDGFYNLTLSNPGAEYVAYSLYYDQSCACAAKAFPVDDATRQLVVPNGYVIFNTDAGGPSAVEAQFNKPAALSLKISAAVLVQPGGRWPTDFTTLGTTSSLVQTRADPSVPPVWVYDLNVTVPGASRLYYFVQATAVDPANLSQPQSTAVWRYFASSPVRPTGSLSPLILIGVAALLAAAGAVILWRGRGRQRPAPKGKDAAKKGKKTTGKKDGRTTSASRRHGGGRGGGRRRTSPARKRRG